MILDGDDDDLPVGGTEPLEDQDDTEDQDTEIEPVEQDSDLPAPEEEPVAPPRKMTANEVIRTTKARLRQAELDLAAERAARNVMRPPTAPPVDPAVEAANERRKLEDMPEVDRVQYMANRIQQQSAIQMQQLRLEMQVQADKQAFRDTIAAVPAYQKYKDIVEQEFDACMQRGQPRTRDELLSIAIGNEVKANRAAAVNKARRTADKNIQRETVIPASTRSGVPGSNRKEAQSAEDILKSRLEQGAYWQ